MMRVARNIMLMCISLCWQLGSYAQDIHFSQFYQSPFSLNPALCGDFDGAYRLIGNQRTQWRSVTVPYSTLGFAADMAHFSKKDLGIGVSFFSDKAGDSRYTTTMFNLAAAKRLTIRGQEKHTLALGLMLGLTSMSIDYSQLNYDNQWTGLVYDPNINSGERFARDSRVYSNLHIGVNYQRPMNAEWNFKAGMSMFNLSSPKQSWFDNAFVRLNVRTNVYASAIWKVNDLWQLEPMMLWMNQGQFNEVNLGGRAHYILESKPWMYRSFYGGIMGRAKDAGYIILGMRYDQWDVGISYDINTSTLKPASNGRGGLEFGVIYVIPPKPIAKATRKVCPDYI
ncbi:MAG: PorP/SprF family type IX secretion system membrane protein [Flavobacteriales bacterium]